MKTALRIAACVALLIAINPILSLAFIVSAGGLTALWSQFAMPFLGAIFNCAAVALVCGFGVAVLDRMDRAHDYTQSEYYARMRQTKPETERHEPPSPSAS